MDLERKQMIGILLVVAALAGLLIVPLLVQRFYGVNAVKTTFVVIVVYAVINYYMKKG